MGLTLQWPSNQKLAFQSKPECQFGQSCVLYWSTRKLTNWK